MNITAFSKDEGKPVVGLAYVDLGFSKSHFDWKIYNQSKNAFDEKAYAHYNTSMIDWRVGGSLLGLVLKKRIKNWFIGDALELSVAGGYGRLKELRIDSTNIHKEGTVALGANIRWGAMGFYKINKDWLAGARYQWILQQEFLAFVLTGDNINPHRKQLTLFGAYKNTTAEIGICTPFRLTMNAPSQTRYNHSGYCFSLKQKLGKKFYCGITAERVHLRYHTQTPWNFNYNKLMQNEWWRGLFTLGIGI